VDGLPDPPPSVCRASLGGRWARLVDLPFRFGPRRRRRCAHMLSLRCSLLDWSGRIRNPSTPRATGLHSGDGAGPRCGGAGATAGEWLSGERGASSASGGSAGNWGVPRHAEFDNCIDRKRHARVCRVQKPSVPGALLANVGSADKRRGLSRVIEHKRRENAQKECRRGAHVRVNYTGDPRPRSTTRLCPTLYRGLVQPEPRERSRPLLNQRLAHHQ